MVVEIALGDLLGPVLLGFIAHPHDLHLLKELGVIFLFFLAGFEVDINGVRGGPLRRAIRTWGISLAIAVPIGYAMAAGDLITHPGIVALAFVTTALGPLVTIMQDRRQMTTPFGSHVMAIGAIGEFGPVLLAAFLLNGDQATWLTDAELALDVFIESPRAWITVPLAVIGSLVIRGTPIYLLYTGIDLLTKRRLPLVTALMSRFTARGWVPTDIATGIIVGAVITVAVFPLMALHDIDNNDPNGQLLQTKSS